MKYHYRQITNYKFCLILVLLFSKVYGQNIQFVENKNYNGDTLLSIEYEYGEKFWMREEFFNNGNKKLSLAGSGNTITGPRLSYYKNGKIESIKFFIHDIEINTWLFFDSSGNMLEKREYGFNPKDLTLKLKYDTTYFLGDVDGEYAVTPAPYKMPNDWFIYYPNGKIKSEQHYLNYKKSGKWKYYDENEKIIKVVHYKEGILIKTENFK